jgi:glycosyltransferase involved in cell wall biosynthesis
LTDVLIDASIIIPCRNEGNFLRETLDSILNSKNNLLYEVIVVDDGSKDDCTAFLESPYYMNIYRDMRLIKTNMIGPGGARNAGAELSKGKYLFFFDGHVKVSDYWLDNLVNTLDISKAHIAIPCIVDILNPASVGYGMTWDSQLNVLWQSCKPDYITEIPVGSSCAFAIEKEVFNKIYKFDSLFMGYGVEDQEICIKAWLFGYRVVLDPSVKVQHLFRRFHPYPIIEAHGIHNLLCLAYYHFKLERLKKLIQRLSCYNAYAAAVAPIKNNAELVISRRNKYFRERKYDDDFFFEKFHIPF